MSRTHSWLPRGLSFPACTRVGDSSVSLVLSLAGQCRTGGAARKPGPPGPSGEYGAEPRGLPHSKLLILLQEARHSVAHLPKVA